MERSQKTRPPYAARDPRANTTVAPSLAVGLLAIAATLVGPPALPDDYILIPPDWETPGDLCRLVQDVNRDADPGAAYRRMAASLTQDFLDKVGQKPGSIYIGADDRCWFRVQPESDFEGRFGFTINCPNLEFLRLRLSSHAWLDKDKWHIEVRAEHSGYGYGDRGRIRFWEIRYGQDVVMGQSLPGEKKKVIEIEDVPARWARELSQREGLEVTPTGKYTVEVTYNPGALAKTRFECEISVW